MGRKSLLPMEVTLEPSVLRWARERAGLSLDELARKVNTRPEKVVVWEQNGQLTLKQAETLARKTYTPFAVLYLDAPPVETLPVADFRVVGGASVAKPSPELLDTLGAAIERQEWFRDYLRAGGEKPLAWVGSLRGDEPVEATAQRICETFALETQARRTARTWEEALKLCCDCLEAGGVLVMRSGIVGENTRRPLRVEEFRGFALADEFAPLIFINSRDFKAAQIFTLMHELVHLWLGLSGVSNLQQTYAANRETERFCNAVAAQILVPSAELRAAFTGRESLEEIARHFKVSLLVALRRLRDLEMIAEGEFTRQYLALLGRFKQESENVEGSGGDYYRTKISRLGKRFTAALLESTLHGQTPPTEAFRLLGVRNFDKLKNLAKEMKFDLP